jgi:hypothetical protein
MRLSAVFTAVMFTLVSAQVAAAASCSSWKGTCLKRVRPQFVWQCESKFSACLTSGCFTEGPKFGAATHCGLTKK